MQADSCSDHSLLRAKAIADGIMDVAAELRMMNVADYVSFIHLEQFNNIRDIVNSSMELYFKHGTLSYGCSADYELEWDQPPSILLDLEFRHHEILVRFNLVLRAAHASVEICDISFASGSLGEVDDTRRLVAAIADAKLTATPF
ncbi:MAG: hypothetical protein ACLQL2_12230 [Methylovirgula sp.]